MKNAIIVNTFCLMLPLLSGCGSMANWQVEAESLCCPLTIYEENSLPDNWDKTERVLDIAIIGEGYFQCIDPMTGEIFYTRWGRFGINDEGLLMHAEPCDPVNGDSPIWLEGPFGINGDGYSKHTEPFVGRLVHPAVCFPEGAQKVQIHDDGTVWVLDANDGDPIYGQIELATFANPDGLEQMSETMYRETEASGRAIVNQPGIEGTGMLKTHYLEKIKVKDCP
jgi:flagellar basal-body rod protein FlgG